MRGRKPPIPGLAALLLGNPEIAEQLMRALEIKGDLPQFLEAGFQPTITALDLGRDEYWWLKRGSRWNLGVNVAPVAGQQPFISLMANVGANRSTIAIVDRIIISNTNAAPLIVSYGISFLGTGQPITSQGNQMDDRQFGSPRAQYAAGGNTQAAPAIPGSAPVVSIPAGANMILEKPNFVLTARDNGIFVGALIVAGATPNQGMMVVFQWRERVAATTETQS